MNFFKAIPAPPHRMALSSIRFFQGDKEIFLCVQDDVTPKEATLISVMFSVAVGTAITMALWDYIGYIEEHGLMRHFEIKEKL